MFGSKLPADNNIVDSNSVCQPKPTRKYSLGQLKHPDFPRLAENSGQKFSVLGSGKVF